MRPQKLQQAFFFHDLFLTNETELSRFIIAMQDNAGTQAIFTQNPQRIPVPPGAPAEIPRVIFQGVTPSITFRVTQNRADLIASEEDISEERLNEFIRYSNIMFVFLKEHGVGVVNRFGFVIEALFTVPPGETPVSFVASQFFNEKVQTPKELKFQYNSLGHTQIGQVEHDLNRIIQIVGREDKEEVLVQLDVNTLKEDADTANLDVDALSSFQTYLRATLQYLQEHFPNALLG